MVVVVEQVEIDLEVKDYGERMKQLPVK